MPVASTLLVFFAFLFFPFAALAPRLMHVLIIGSTLALVPVFLHHARALKNHMNGKVLLGLSAAVLYAVFSAFWSPSAKAPAMAIDISYLTLCGVFLFMGLRTITDKTMRYMQLAVLGGWGLGLVLLLIEMGFNFPIHRAFNGLDALAPIAENVPKRMAALFAIGIWPMALFLQMQGRKYLAAASIVILFLLLVFLGNRSALLGLAVGMGVFAFAHVQAALTRWVLLSVLIAGLVLIVPLSLMLPKGAGPATDMLFASANHRIKIWTLTAEQVLDAPLWGHGLDASRGLQAVIDESAGPYLKPGIASIAQHPHNIFLQLWLDFGLVGTFLWGALLVFMVDRTRLLPIAAQPAVLAALYCSLAMLNTTYSLLQAWWAAGHVGVAALLLLGCYSLSRKTDTSGTSAGGIT